MRMTRLDDFLVPLHEGVWEVCVAKTSITEPPGPAWKQSALNIPSPGTIASYRNGQYHAHETQDEWKVHLDRYDPKVHPLLHLVDDAPLLLMIAGTVGTLIRHAGTHPGDDTNLIIKEQQLSWQRQVLVGVAVLIAGSRIISDPLGFFSDITRILIPLFLAGLGVVVLAKSLDARSPGSFYGEGIVQGVCIIGAGIIAGFLPELLWSLVILMVLGVWSCASAVILLARVFKGRTAVPEGFFSRMIIGGCSLLFALLLLVAPKAGVIILTGLLGIIASLAGLVLVINGLRLRDWMKTRTAQ